MGSGSPTGTDQVDTGRAPERSSHEEGAQILRGETGRATECRITVDGVEYRLAPIGTTIRILAQEEIAKRRRSLWKEAIDLVKEIKGEEGKALLVEAYQIQQRTVVTSIEESLAWLVSPEGDRFHFAQSIKRFQPSLSEDKITEVYDHCTASQLNTFRDFQYLAYNPDMVESALGAAAFLDNNSELIPEEILDHVQVLIDHVKRMV